MGVLDVKQKLRMKDLQQDGFERYPWALQGLKRVPNHFIYEKIWEDLEDYKSYDIIYFPKKFAGFVYLNYIPRDLRNCVVINEKYSDDYYVLEDPQSVDEIYLFLETILKETAQPLAKNEKVLDDYKPWPWEK